MCHHLKFLYEVLNLTAPNWNALNETMQSQTKPSITKTQCTDKREDRA